MDNNFLTLFRTGLLTESTGLDQILQTNEQSAQHGLRITPSDAAELAETRRTVLKDLDRIEFGGATIVRLIEAFCDSAYINQDEYAEVLQELLTLFYTYKNETLDQIPDDLLISLMRTYFEERCHGSLELLAGRELDRMARNIRFGRHYDDDGEDMTVTEDEENENDNC
ncbi:MAG: DUF6323 family protein [Clostridiaceae bacterium]|nr:DUF6323 family protein [Clostridiaceae bacterium]